MSGPFPRGQVCWLGQVDYDEAWKLQIRLADQIAAGRCLPTILLLEHPPVITIGRRGGRGHILWSEDQLTAQGIQVRDVDRGGDVTYHGPGQLVGYPLLPLAKPGWAGERLPQADFTGYIRKLEFALCQLLAGMGIQAISRPGLTGVWISGGSWAAIRPNSPAEPAKIASIGVKVDGRGISRHGFALNVKPDPSHWEAIIPCGLHGVQMASLADFIEPPEMRELAESTAEVLATALGYQLDWLEDLSRNLP